MPHAFLQKSLLTLAALSLVGMHFAPWAILYEAARGADPVRFSVEADTWELRCWAEGFGGRETRSAPWSDVSACAAHDDGTMWIRGAQPALVLATALSLWSAAAAGLGRTDRRLIGATIGISVIAATVFTIGITLFFEDAKYRWGPGLFAAVAAVLFSAVAMRFQARE